MKKLLLIFLIIIPNLILGVTFYNNDLTFGSQDIDDNVSINFSGLGFSGVIRGDSAFSRFKIQESGGPETDLVFKNTQGRVPYAGANGYATATDGLFFDAGNVRLGVNSAVPTETLDVIGNAKISNSIQNKITIYEHATKPAAPSAGYTKNYYKADGKYYALTAGDVETEIAGADGGAAGEFNYIDPNGDAELLTTYGWACTGNLSIASATTTQLFGSGYFTITAAATSADDYCAYDFDLDGGDTAAMLSSIVERIRTGTGFDTNDASIRLYDLDKPGYVENNSKIYASSIGQRHTAGFQTHATHTNYEWRIVSNVDTTFTFDFDNVKLQRQGANKGVPYVYMGELTTVGSWTSNTTYVGKYWRAADKLNAEITITLSGAPNAVSLTLDLPNGLSMDTQKESATLHLVGNSLPKDITVGNFLGTAYASSTTPTKISIGRIVTGGADASSATITATAPFTFASSDTVTVNYEVAIAGWQAEADMSSTTLNRDIIAEYNSNGGEVITVAVTDIPFSTKINDSVSAWDGNEFTLPEDGRYEFEGIVYFTASFLCRIDLYIGGVHKKQVSNRVNDGTHAFRGSYTGIKGEKISFRTGTTGGTLLASGNYHWITISKDNTGTEKLFETARTTFSASTNNSQSIPNSTSTTLIFEDVEEDSMASYNSTTGIYTMKDGGTILAKTGMLYTNTAGWDAGETRKIEILKNGTAVRAEIETIEVGAINKEFGVSCFAEIPVVIGDTIKVNAEHTLGGALPLINVGKYNYFSIHRIK